MWPTDPAGLVDAQQRLSREEPEPWHLLSGPLVVGGCWVCFPRGLTGRGEAGDPAWTAAVRLSGRRVVDAHVVAGEAGGPYVPGMLALRIGPLLEQAVRALPGLPDVLMLDASGRDHPRRAGLAIQLGAVLDLPTVGITHRPLLGEGDWPEDRDGATSPLRVDGEVVGCWMRTAAGTRPLVVHPGWRVDLATAVEVVRRTAVRRTPEPLRQARHRARIARAANR